MTENKLNDILVSLRPLVFVVLLAICPIVFYQGEVDSRTFQNMFFNYTAVGAIAVFCGNFWLGMFLLYNIFSFIWAGADTGSMQLGNITFGVSLFMLSRVFFRKNSFLPYTKYLVWVALASIIFMILQMLRIDPIHVGQNSAGVIMHRPFSDPVGLFKIKECSGTFLSFVVPILTYSNPVLGALLMFPILTSHSSSVALASLVVLAISVYYFHRHLFKWFLLALFIGTIGYFVYDFNKDPYTFKSRFPVWHSTAKFGLSNPLGFGPDSYRNHNRIKNFMFVGDANGNHWIERQIDKDKRQLTYYSMTNDRVESERKAQELVENGLPNGEYNLWDNPHNGFLQMLFQYGYIGVFLLFGLMREIWFRWRFCIKNGENVILFCGLLVFAITSITHFPLELARTACIFPVFLGAFYAKTD